jgi:hypothetical protein
MNHGEQSTWLYGYDAEPLAARGQRCCLACYEGKVLPAEEARRAAEEARYAAYAEARRAKAEGRE